MEPERAQLQQTAPVYGIVSVLVAAALATFAVFLVDVGADLLPPKPLNPLWLLNAATVLVDALSIPIAGVLFLHLASALAPLTELGQLCRTWASRVATMLALLFLCLLPLLGFATWRGIDNVRTEVNQRVGLINRNADRVRSVILKASSPKQLQQFMVDQDGPAVSAEELNTPLSTLKKTRLLLVDQIRSYYLSQIPGFKSKSYQPLFIQTLRTTALAIAGSAGFAALAWNPNRQKSLLRVLLDIRNRTNARIANKLNSFRPVPDEKGRNSRLMQESRKIESKLLLRNKRKMDQLERQQRANFERIERQRKKQKENERKSE